MELEGIINAFKAAYKRLFLLSVLQKLELHIQAYKSRNEAVPRDLAAQVANKFTLQDAIECIEGARDYMRAHRSIIKNCWRTAQLSEADTTKAVEREEASAPIPLPRTPSPPPSPYAAANLLALPQPLSLELELFEASSDRAVTAPLEAVAEAPAAEPMAELFQELDHLILRVLPGYGSDRLGAQAYIDLEPAGCEFKELTLEEIAEEVLFQLQSTIEAEVEASDAHDVVLADPPAPTLDQAHVHINNLLLCADLTHEHRRQLFELKRHLLAVPIQKRTKQSTLDSFFKKN